MTARSHMLFTVKEGEPETAWKEKPTPGLEPGTLHYEFVTRR
jgi:hypothetical protein